MLWSLALVDPTEGVPHCGRTAFVQNLSRQHATRISSVRHSQRCYSAATTKFMANNDDDDVETDVVDEAPPTERLLDPKRPDENLPAFMDAMLEIPDPRMFAGDLLFILIINFLLQIANEVGDPEFWRAGGFGQPVTLPTTLAEVVVRDSEMSIAWVLGALWNRAYSSSAVADDRTAVKTALQIWVSYCSLRISIELGESLLFTHSSINIWMIGREVWYTAVVMSFFRLAYGRVRNY